VNAVVAAKTATAKSMNMNLFILFSPFVIEAQGQ
jgi:hypothetical protein